MAQERFLIRGDVGAPGFPRWIERHANRLGLDCRMGALSADCVTADLQGPPDLLDAMALGCSLGPIEVWVERVERHRNAI